MRWPGLTYPQACYFTGAWMGAAVWSATSLVDGPASPAVVGMVGAFAAGMLVPLWWLRAAVRDLERSRSDLMQARADLIAELLAERQRLLLEMGRLS